MKKKDTLAAVFRSLTFASLPPKRNVSKAQVAELVDALASGASVRMDAYIRLMLRAQLPEHVDDTNAASGVVLRVSGHLWDGSKKSCVPLHFPFDLARAAA